MKGSRAIFKENMAIVMAPDICFPSSVKNKFAPYTDKCHAIMIGMLRTVTQARSNKLALVKFLSLTRTQVAPTAFRLFSLARLT